MLKKTQRKFSFQCQGWTVVILLLIQTAEQETEEFCSACRARIKQRTYHISYGDIYENEKLVIDKKRRTEILSIFPKLFGIDVNNTKAFESCFHAECPEGDALRIKFEKLPFPFFLHEEEGNHTPKETS
jgi:hypothetical protein